MLENKTIQGYKYIKVDDVNIAYLSAVIPSSGMGTLSVNVQVMSKDMLENNKEYFLEEYNKFKKRRRRRSPYKLWVGCIC